MNNFKFQPRMDIFADEVIMVQNAVRNKSVETFLFVIREEIRMAIKSAAMKNISFVEYQIETTENEKFLLKSDDEEEKEDILENAVRNIKKELKENGFSVSRSGYTLKIGWGQ